MQEIDNRYTQWDEQIDSFLRKQLSEDEEKAFLEQMKHDSEFHDYVTMSALLVDGIMKQGKENDEKVMESLRHTNRSELNYMLGKTDAAKAKRVVWIPGVAAVAAVFIGLIIVNKNMVNDGISDYASSQSSTSEYMRGAGNDSLSAEITHLTSNVKNKQFMASTIVRLEELYQTSTDDVTDDEDEYAYTIGWQLATAYIENNQKDEAKAILTEMHKSYPKDEKVSTLLKKLDNTFFWE